MRVAEYIAATFAMSNISQQRPQCDIDLAVDFILSGGIVGVPTETVYGLAADATNESAVRKIFTAKGRPFIDPLIVHVCDMDMAESVADFSEDAKKLATSFWGGPLTMILPKKDSIGDIVTAGHPTVAIRMPSHPIMAELIKKSGKPIAAPSANPFGYVSPTRAEHVREQLGDKIDFVLDGGECSCGVESTIISMVSSPKKLLRPGPISAEEIEKILDEEIDKSPKKNEAHPQAPGMLKSHYSPTSRLTLFNDSQEIPANFSGDVIFFKRPQNPTENQYWLSENGDCTEAARNLFALIRKLDKASKRDMFCQRAPNSGVGVAINDRLSRAETKFDK